MYKTITPIVLIIFNRPDNTRITLEAITKVKPNKLYVIADGPRPNIQEDEDNISRTRAIIEECITWDCEVRKNYAQKNLGLKERVASGLSWVFETEDRAIILEDDCIPSVSFFRYCDELLEKYRSDENIMMISGNNFLLNGTINDSYYFSKYTDIWGWATWSRAWENYDKAMPRWPEFKEKGLLTYLFDDVRERVYWEEILEATYQGRIDTWDYQWAFAMWSNAGMSICPQKNLIKNVGFDENATHTKEVNKVSYLKAQELSFPLKHPTFLVRNAEADKLECENLSLHKHSFIGRVRAKIRRKFRAQLKRLTGH